MRTLSTISAAVEGLLDEAVIRRLITYVGCAPGTVYGKNGKGALRQTLAACDRAVQNGPWDDAGGFRQRLCLRAGFAPGLTAEPSTTLSRGCA